MGQPNISCPRLIGFKSSSPTTFGSPGAPKTNRLMLLPTLTDTRWKPLFGPMAPVPAGGNHIKGKISPMRDGKVTNSRELSLSGL